jgi:hypothetical protein
MAALMAMIMPVVVSPILMLDTSMAVTGVSSRNGLSGIVLSLSLVCPWNVGVIASDG